MSASATLRKHLETSALFVVKEKYVCYDKDGKNVGEYDDKAEADKKCPEGGSVKQESTKPLELIQSTVKDAIDLEAARIKKEEVSADPQAAGGVTDPAKLGSDSTSPTAKTGDAAASGAPDGAAGASTKAVNDPAAAAQGTQAAAAAGTSTATSAAADRRPAGSSTDGAPEVKEVKDAKGTQTGIEIKLEGNIKLIRRGSTLVVFKKGTKEKVGSGIVKELMGGDFKLNDGKTYSASNFDILLLQA